MTAILRLPYLSEALPHDALVSAQATAEIEKIVDVSITDKPRSLANGGTKTKAKDWPKPTANKPNFNQVVGLDNVGDAYSLTQFTNKLLSLRTNFTSAIRKQII